MLTNALTIENSSSTENQNLSAGKYLEINLKILLFCSSLMIMLTAQDKIKMYMQAVYNKIHQHNYFITLFYKLTQDGRIRKQKY